MNLFYPYNKVLREVLLFSTPFYRYKNLSTDWSVTCIRSQSYQVAEVRF